MSAHKYLFLKEQIRHNGTEIIIPEGFSLKEDPLIVQTVRAVLKCFPEELKKVFPVNVEEALRETEMGKYFEVFHELVVETRIKSYSSEEYLEILSLNIIVSVVAREVGVFSSRFQIFIPSKDEPAKIKGHNYGSEKGEWELLIGGNENIPEGNLSFKEAVKKLGIVAKEFERKKQERIQAEVRGTEGLGVLFA